MMSIFQAEDGIRSYKVTGVQTCALPISQLGDVLLRSDPSADGLDHALDFFVGEDFVLSRLVGVDDLAPQRQDGLKISQPDRKSTRLNSSHLVISYAVFCLKKKITRR